MDAGAQWAVMAGDAGGTENLSTTPQLNTAEHRHVPPGTDLDQTARSAHCGAYASGCSSKAALQNLTLGGSPANTATEVNPFVPKFIRVMLLI